MILLNWNFELDIKKDLLYNSSFKMKKKTIENTFIQWKRKISSDIELISNFYPSPMFSSSKLLRKKLFSYSYLEQRIFIAQKEREKCDNYYQPQKRRKKREEREAKVRNWTVYFSRRDVSASKRGRNEGRERERETNQGKSASWIWVKSGRRGIKRAEPKPRTCQEKLPRGDNSARSKRKQQEVDGGAGCATLAEVNELSRGKKFHPPFLKQTVVYTAEKKYHVVIIRVPRSKDLILKERSDVFRSFSTESSLYVINSWRRRS